MPLKKRKRLGWTIKEKIDAVDFFETHTWQATVVSEFYSTLCQKWDTETNEKCLENFCFSNGL